MESKNLTTYIIIFNVLMAIFLFLSSQLILLQLSGYKIVGVDTSIHYDYSFTPSGTPIPTAILFPIPNYPLMIFIIMIVVNIYFYYRLRKTNSTPQN
jgi:hypothetical protein